ncbi:MAG TPA: hypothetical protein VI819_03130 [Patescibacteria group bacterium]|nr:hypothetical protein [Patescibacteria group bacterium]
MKSKLHSLQNLLALGAAALIITVWATVTFLKFQNNIFNKFTEGSTKTESNNPTATPNPTPKSVTSDWITYTSSKLGYSFQYPKDWELFTFNENDPQVKFGSHSLHNYSGTEISKFMDHGITDWNKFMREKAAVKIDFAVYSEKEGPNQYQNKEEFLKNLLPDSSKIVSKSDLIIGNLKTDQYKATENLGPTDVPEANTFIAYPNDFQIIYINLMFWNTKDYASLKQSQEWQELSQILSTFRFTGTEEDSGKFCGGIAGLACPEGYTCIYDGDYPDAGGTCRKN